MRSIRKYIIMEFDYSFTNKAVTPWGGIVLFKQFLEKIDISKQIDLCEDLPQPGSNRGYSVQTIIESFMCSIWCGANRFAHTEITRFDKALCGIFGWKHAPAQDAYKRFFSKFTQSINHKVSNHFYSWLFSNLKFDNFTLDCDSSVMTRYGNQEGAAVGYNPNKKGRASHHPLIAFVNEVRMVANMWLRSGNTSSSNNFLSFLEDTLDKLKDKNISLIRLDSGFFSSDILDYLEKTNRKYIIAAKFYHPIQKLID